MKIAIELIKVDEEMRIRKELGNLKPLEESITKVGLLNPIVIDEDGQLLAGFRRLAACRNLGMTEVDVNVVNLGGDLIQKLDVELAENFYRKDFTPEEILASEMRRREILEASRKKGTFERFWLWLKSLFGSPPQEKKDRPEDEMSKTPDTAEEVKTTETSGKEKTTEAVQDGKQDLAGESRVEPFQQEMEKDAEEVIKWREK